MSEEEIKDKMEIFNATPAIPTQPIIQEPVKPEEPKKEDTYWMQCMMAIDNQKRITQYVVVGLIILGIILAVVVRQDIYHTELIRACACR